MHRGGGRDDRNREFMLVTPSNINIPVFIGKAFNSNPYLQFNNAIRQLLLAQGTDGDQILVILDRVEKMCSNTFINDMLTEFAIIFSLRLRNSTGQLRRHC